jgi:1-deoxy-D-xylulose-5-phosphate reductoisomerase
VVLIGVRVEVADAVAEALLVAAAVLEARWLFDIPSSQIDIVVHRESIIHSLVEYRDGSVIAQLGLPDMRTPISYALNFPERVPLDPPPLDLAKIGKLTFYPPDWEKFPCPKLAYEALHVGRGMPATLNAANEVAVQAFLNQEIRYIDIAKVIHNAMSAYVPGPLNTVEDALDVDRWAREKSLTLIGSYRQ